MTIIKSFEVPAKKWENLFGRIFTILCDYGDWPNSIIYPYMKDSKRIRFLKAE